MSSRLSVSTFPSATLALACTLVALAAGQVLAQAPTQNRVDYTLDARLDPASHSLEVTGSFTFHNRSGRAIDSIPVQLWGNAFATSQTPYAQQKRRFGDVTFHYAPETDRGGYRDLRFDGDNLAARSEVSPELTWLHLVNSIPPGDSARVALAYTLRIPKAFSRMGRSGSAYYLTQWYPKVPLLDSAGWHPEPYLDFGEYFNEFGDYTVAVTVPTGGMVAATGIPADEPTAELLRERIDLTTRDTAAVDATLYAAGTQTFRYRARNVTDFAVFVDPSFRVAMHPARLRAREIPAYAFYPGAVAHLWRHADSLLARATVFADSLVGAYPHPQVTAVAAPTTNGGGMEYPMITLIGPTSDLRSLDIVLAHEAFHNWFALTVATDERRRAWMDEGLTTWLEHRYVERYYGGGSVLDNLPRFIGGGSPYDEASLLHRVLATARRHPAPETHSDSLTEFGYGYAAYTQPGALLSFAEHALGRETFDAGMRRYYAQWQMRHPGPRDLQRALGGDTLAWLFDSLLLDNALPDYRIVSAERDGALVTVEIDNRGDVPIPLILGYDRPDDTYVESVTLPGFRGRQTFQLSVPEDAERVAIDPLARSPELERGDNYRALESITPGIEPLALRIGTGFGRPDRTNLALVPLVSYNAADRWLFGIGVHNLMVDQGATRFHVLPQVATRDASLNGVAGLRHSLYRDRGWWRELEFAIDARQYHYHYNETYDFNDRFQRATLAVNLLLASAPGLRRDHRLGFRAHTVAQLYAEGRDPDLGLFVQQRRNYRLADLNYTFQRRDPITPWSARAGVDGGKGFARFTGELDYAWRYQQRARFVRVRAFAGAFAFRQNPTVPAFLLPNGVTGFRRDQFDYRFEENIINRAERSQQVFTRDGSLTLPFLLSDPFSDSWLTSVSVSVDAPVRLLFVQPRVYADLAVYPTGRAGESGLLAPATAGIRLALPRDIFSVSFPLVNSAYVRENLVFTKVGATYRERIAFSLDLDVLNVAELLRELRG